MHYPETIKGLKFGHVSVAFAFIWYMNKENLPGTILHLITENVILKRFLE